MKIIDAHAHIGYFGSFFDVGITPSELVDLMDEFNIEKVVISTLDNEETRKAAEKYPDRIIPTAWINP